MWIHAAMYFFIVGLLPLSVWIILHERRKRWPAKDLPCIRALERAQKLEEDTKRRLANAGLGTKH
jgi:hypothetical protein